ncbi:hypothetical protein [Microbacterium sp.]|uniref:hypothetical protein n=1 Tax=Microbacterium sp. TaxID=51671 RepID=UPI003C732BCB
MHWSNRRVTLCRALRARTGARVGAAHFVVVGYASSGERALGEWLASSALVEGIHSAVPPDPAANAVSASSSTRPVVGWRMIASNGRELARSVGVFRSERDAEHHVRLVQASGAELEFHPVAARSPRGVGWCATAEGRPLLMSARWYESRVVARNAAALTRRTLIEGLAAPLEHGTTLRVKAVRAARVEDLPLEPST